VTWYSTLIQLYLEHFSKILLEFYAKESCKPSHIFPDISMYVENTAEIWWCILSGRITLILILSRKMWVCGLQWSSSRCDSAAGCCKRGRKLLTCMKSGVLTVYYGLKTTGGSGRNSLLAVRFDITRLVFSIMWFSHLNKNLCLFRYVPTASLCSEMQGDERILLVFNGKLFTLDLCNCAKLHWFHITG
jgi:hypothetical protein